MALRCDCAGESRRQLGVMLGQTETWQNLKIRLDVIPTCTCTSNVCFSSKISKIPHKARSLAQRRKMDRIASASTGVRNRYIANSALG